MPRMKKEPTDLTLRVLEQIRDGVAQTNLRLDTTNGRLDEAIERIGRVEKRQTEMEIRLASELVGVVGAVTSLRDAILSDRDLRRAVDDHESRLRTLERKTG